MASTREREETQVINFSKQPAPTMQLFVRLCKLDMSIHAAEPLPLHRQGQQASAETQVELCCLLLSLGGQSPHCYVCC